MRSVLNIGHRGAAGHTPENTVKAIQAGIALGVDFIEIDVRRTADGALVILHDETVNRTTNGKGRIDHMSLREAKQLTVGTDESIPTLEEAISACAGRTGLLLELKVTGVARQTVETVQEAGFATPVIYASFLHDELTQVQMFDPNAPRMALFATLPRHPVARILTLGTSHVGFRYDKASRRLIEDFHRVDRLVCVYTVDHPRDIRHVLSLGVDGVISNYPDRIRSTQREGLLTEEPVRRMKKIPPSSV